MQALSSTFLAWGAFVVPLALYVSSLSPHVAFWDTGEMQTVPAILGIAHPTGFPLFVLLGWLFAHGIPISSVAWRIGLLSAVAMASASWCLYAAARECGVSGAVALGAAWLFAFSGIVWAHGSRAEVHALAVALGAASLLFALRFERDGSVRNLLASAAALGLGLATHPVVLFVLPGLLVIGARRLRAVGFRAGAIAVALVLASLMLYLYLPLRSAEVSAQRLDPTLSLGVGAGRPFWDYDHPSTLDGFRHEVMGSDFSAGGTTLGALVDVKNYGMRAFQFSHVVGEQIGFLSLAFAFFGIMMLARPMPWRSIGLLIAGSGAVLFAFSFRAESDVDRYLILPIWITIVAAAFGAETLARLTISNPRIACACAGVVMIASALVIGLNNRGMLSQRTDDRAEQYVQWVRASTPDNAIVIAAWPYATPLAYTSYVDRALGRRIVETAWVGEDLPYLPSWSARLPVFAVSASPLERLDPHFVRVRAVDLDTVILYWYRR
ncbi:MAG TPA: DUF2723 domain-containing protein [Candidatus Baltobacteraceae bacterium]|jgi:hypothetical protein|nr:DUF2723 domain-containing protein [Candidatus Baltobacteraceae bacterium]